MHNAKLNIQRSVKELIVKEPMLLLRDYAHNTSAKGIDETKAAAEEVFELPNNGNFRVEDELTENHLEDMGQELNCNRSLVKSPQGDPNISPAASQPDKSRIPALA